MGLGRLELPTSRLSGVRSNHVSYRPARGTEDRRWSRRVNARPRMGDDLDPGSSGGSGMMRSGGRNGRAAVGTRRAAVSHLEFVALAVVALDRPVRKQRRSRPTGWPRPRRADLATAVRRFEPTRPRPETGRTTCGARLRTKPTGPRPASGAGPRAVGPAAGRTDGGPWTSLRDGRLPPAPGLSAERRHGGRGRHAPLDSAARFGDWQLSHERRRTWSRSHSDSRHDPDGDPAILAKNRKSRYDYLMLDEDVGTSRPFQSKSSPTRRFS